MRNGLDISQSSYNTGKHPDTVPECKSLKEGKHYSFGEQCGLNNNHLNKHIGEKQKHPGVQVLSKDLNHDITHLNDQTLDSSVGRAVDCSWNWQTSIGRWFKSGSIFSLYDQHYKLDNFL